MLFLMAGEISGFKIPIFLSILVTHPLIPALSGRGNSLFGRREGKRPRLPLVSTYSPRPGKSFFSSLKLFSLIHSYSVYFVTYIPSLYQLEGRHRYH